MKRILLSIFAIVSFTASSVFGYFNADNFIDFLVHDQQLRVRLDRLGVLATIKDFRLAVGFTGALNDVILDNLVTGSKNQGINTFKPAALVGFGYESDMFGVGVGYQFKYINYRYQVHTPVLTATAMNNAFRINVPVHIGIGSGPIEGTMNVSTDIELRYYTGMTAFSHLRLYVKYGNDTSRTKDMSKSDYLLKAQSVGVQLRLYFGAMVGDILVEPILRVQYDQALKNSTRIGGVTATATGHSFDITAGDGSVSDSINGGYIADTDYRYGNIDDPYRFGIAMPVGFTANSDIVSLYLEPALSLTLIGGRNMTYEDGGVEKARKDPFYTFGYVVYGEIYITPLPALEWYFEAQTGGATVANGLAGQRGETSLVFNTSTGITWYF